MNHFIIEKQIIISFWFRWNTEKTIMSIYKTSYLSLSHNLFVFTQRQEGATIVWLSHFIHVQEIIRSRQYRILWAYKQAIMAFLLPAVYSLSGHKKVEEEENSENIFIPFGFSEESVRRDPPDVQHGGPELRCDHIS